MFDKLKSAYSKPETEVLNFELVSSLCEMSVNISDYPTPYEEVEL